MTTTAMSSGSQSGRMHSPGNALQRAAPTLSRFPFPRGLAFAFGVGVGFLVPGLHDLELTVA